ncbi:30S ribosomal protein S20 [Patescibacteria group bacterium]|nr:30S ribosomal protein S20 [Patescibacteria group bacterium]
MPIIKSAIKKMRRDVRRRSANLKIKAGLKKAIKTAHQKPTDATLLTAQKALDKAAKTNLVHKNKAARLKSRLVKAARKNARR